MQQFPVGREPGAGHSTGQASDVREGAERQEAQSAQEQSTVIAQVGIYLPLNQKNGNISRALARHLLRWSCSLGRPASERRSKPGDRQITLDCSLQSAHFHVW